VHLQVYFTGIHNEHQRDPTVAINQSINRSTLLFLSSSQVIRKIAIGFSRTKLFAKPNASSCLLQTFFADLPQPLLNPLPLGTMVIGDNDQVNAPFQDMYSQSMVLSCLYGAGFDDRRSQP
jgi:hypothetical protein